MKYRPNLIWESYSHIKLPNKLISSKNSISLNKLNTKSHSLITRPRGINHRRMYSTYYRLRINLNHCSALRFIDCLLSISFLRLHWIRKFKLDNNNSVIFKSKISGAFSSPVSMGSCKSKIKWFFKQIECILWLMAKLRLLTLI